VPLTLQGLDAFVSQGLSGLTRLTARTLAEDFPDRLDWINEFVLHRIFHNHVRDQSAALAFVLLRRAEAAIDEWELACASSKGDLRSASVYFKVLRHFETCIANLWQGLDFGRRALGRKLFESGDGSAYDRLNQVYNCSRHFDPMQLPQGDLHAVWLTNDSVVIDKCQVSFEEIRDAISVLAHIASKIARGPNSDVVPTA
jgi:hypothetical protein